MIEVCLDPPESSVFLQVDTTWKKKYLVSPKEARLFCKINCFKDGFNWNTRFLISKRGKSKDNKIICNCLQLGNPKFKKRQKLSLVRHFIKWLKNLRKNLNNCNSACFKFQCLRALWGKEWLINTFIASVLTIIDFKSTKKPKNINSSLLTRVLLAW